MIRRLTHRPARQGTHLAWLAGRLVPVALMLASLLAACGKPEPPPGELGRVLDERFRIENPSKTRATATGIGCGLTLDEARTNAKRIAVFNLRGVTGTARYHVDYETLRTIPDDKRVCLEVAAKAVP